MGFTDSSPFLTRISCFGVFLVRFLQSEGFGDLNVRPTAILLLDHFSAVRYVHLTKVGPERKYGICTH